MLLNDQSREKTILSHIKKKKKSKTDFYHEDCGGNFAENSSCSESWDKGLPDPDELDRSRLFFLCRPELGRERQREREWKKRKRERVCVCVWECSFFFEYV